jgi:hypothetical protein
MLRQKPSSASTTWSDSRTVQGMSGAFPCARAASPFTHTGSTSMIWTGSCYRHADFTTLYRVRQSCGIITSATTSRLALQRVGTSLLPGISSSSTERVSNCSLASAPTRHSYLPLSALLNTSAMNSTPRPNPALQRTATGGGVFSESHLRPRQ